MTKDLVSTLFDFLLTKFLLVSIESITRLKRETDVRCGNLHDELTDTISKRGWTTGCNATMKDFEDLIWTLETYQS